MRNSAKPAATLVFCFSVLTCGMCSANGEVPPALPGATVVAAAQVRAMADDARIVDTRILHDYLAGHLPAALHIQYKERSARALDFDPAQDDIPAFLARLHKFFPDKQRSVVFYCNGVSCWKSYKGARAALQDGYRRAFWFRGGMAEWQAQRFETVGE